MTMGANQRASRTIPPSPGTPLRFGSDPAALSYGSGEFTASSRPYAPIGYATDTSLSTLLSQENYFNEYSPVPSMTPSGSEDMSYPRTRSLSSLSSSSDSPPPHPHLFTCPESSCPYAIIGYPTSEELEVHMFAVNHFASGPPLGLDFDDGNWASPQESLELYSQHPLTLQRQRISEQQQKQQQVQQPQQCNCHHCLHQGNYGGFMQYEPPHPSMQIQMPPPPKIIGYHDAGFELVSWGKPKSSFSSSSSQRRHQAEYSSLVQSGMYMDFNQASVAGRSSYM